MKKDSLKELVERTFAKVANPLEGNGIYLELQQAILKAYLLGKTQEDINRPPQQTR